MMADSKQNTTKPWMRGIAFIAVAVLVGWLVGSMLGGDSEHDEHAADSGRCGVYRNVRGVIVRLAPADGVMTVEHEEIAGFMPSKVMDLQLADPREVTPYSPGDEILFYLEHIDGTFQAIRLRPGEIGRASCRER